MLHKKELMEKNRYPLKQAIHKDAPTEVAMRTALL